MPSTTDPTDWFLAETEVPITNGNIATPLIDGEDYYKELTEILTSNSSFSNILISGWRLSKDTIIDNGDELTFEELLTAQVKENADFSVVKSMLWYVPGSIGDFGSTHGVENIEFTEFIIDSGGQAILDNRVPKGRFASHHQKYIIVDGESSKAAFIGGVDIAPDRMDSSAHDNSIPRMEEVFKAWHDVQIKLEGPAVTEAMKMFQERWNDPRRPHDFPTAGNDVPSELSSVTDIGDAGGTHSVQLLRTYACTSDDGDGGQSPYPFAPGGSYDYQNALIKAVKNAEQYIYVEDQYCWPSEVVDELALAVERGVAVILVLTREFEAPGVTPYHNFLRNEAVELMRKAQGDQDLVFVYHLEQAEASPGTQENAELFVHSKTMIIDDRYLVIGSGNLNRRSMTTDTELGVAVVDTTAIPSRMRGVLQEVSLLAQGYRRNLWSEHLGTPAPDDPFDADGFPAGFPKGGSLTGHVRRHTVDEPRFCNPGIIPFALFNSNTTC